jgi:hypothetical protein
MLHHPGVFFLLPSFIGHITNNSEVKLLAHGATRNEQHTAGNEGSLFHSRQGTSWIATVDFHAHIYLLVVSL